MLQYYYRLPGHDCKQVSSVPLEGFSSLVCGTVISARLVVVEMEGCKSGTSSIGITLCSGQGKSVIFISPIQYDRESLTRCWWRGNSHE